jgi:3-oxoacyl-[acyl-carrier protein] reductase
MDRQFDDFSVGDTVSIQRRFTPRDFAAFSTMSGDRNPLHHDGAYAAQSSFGRPIVPLQLAAAPFSAVAGMFLPGHRSLILDSQLRAIEPVDYGTDLVYSAQVIDKHPALQVLTLRVIAVSGSRVLVEGRMRVRVRADVPACAWHDVAEPPIENAHRQHVALVVGGTGTIGAAIAWTLARRGWELILHYRGDNERSREWQEVCRREGVDVHPWPCELGDAASRRRALAALERLPAVSLLVYAASPGIEATLPELIEVNFTALGETAEALLPSMLRRQRGRLVFLGSSGVEHSPPGMENYVAAKVAATHYVGALDRRYSAYGVRGTVVAPGFVRGRFSQRHRPGDAECLLPEEVAEVVADLAEPHAADWGAYVSIAPGLVRHGSFGFKPSSPPMADAASQNYAGRAASPQPSRDVASSGNDPDRQALEAVVRESLRLAEASDLSEAGLDTTPGWDSLAHLQLLLSVESALGIKFSSHEMSQTMRFAELRRLVEAKRSNEQAQRNRHTPCVVTRR